MGGIKLTTKIDRSDLTALKTVKARVELTFDASHKKSVKAPHFEVNVWITEAQRKLLAKNHWGTCKKFMLNNVAVITASKNRLKYEVYSYDKAFYGKNGDVQSALKKLEAGESAGMIKVKLP